MAPINIEDTKTGTTGTTYTPTFAGSNTGCIVGALAYTGSVALTGITCDGSAMSLAKYNVNGSLKTWIYYLATGTLNGAKNVVLSTACHLVAVLAVSNINQTAPLKEVQGSNGPGGDYDLTFAGADAFGMMFLSMVDVNTFSNYPSGYDIINQSTTLYAHLKKTSGVSATETIHIDVYLATVGVSSAASFSPYPSVSGNPVVVSPFLHFIKKWDNCLWQPAGI